MVEKKLVTAAKKAGKHLDALKVRRDELSKDIGARQAELNGLIAHRGERVIAGDDPVEVSADIRHKQTELDTFRDALQALDADLETALGIYNEAKSAELIAGINEKYEDAFSEFDAAYPAIEQLAEHCKKIDEISKESRSLFAELIPLVRQDVKQTIEVSRVNATKTPFRVILASVNTYMAYKRKLLQAAAAKS